MIDYHNSISGNETNRDDLNSIESDFEDKLRATDFKSNITINNLSLNQWWNSGISPMAFYQ